MSRLVGNALSDYYIKLEELSKLDIEKYIVDEYKKDYDDTVKILDYLNELRSD